jgi:hypothetical protein
MQASAGNAENIRDDLNDLDKAVSAVLGLRTIERNQLLVFFLRKTINYLLALQKVSLQSIEMRKMRRSQSQRNLFGYMIYSFR